MDASSGYRVNSCQRVACPQNRKPQRTSCQTCKRPDGLLQQSCQNGPSWGWSEISEVERTQFPRLQPCGRVATRFHLHTNQAYESSAAIPSWHHWKILLGYFYLTSSFVLGSVHHLEARSVDRRVARLLSGVQWKASTSHIRRSRGREEGCEGCEGLPASQHFVALLIDASASNRRFRWLTHPLVEEQPQYRFHFTTICCCAKERPSSSSGSLFPPLVC